MSDTAYQKHIEAGEMPSAPGYPSIQDFAPPGTYKPNTVASPLMVNVVPVEGHPKQCCAHFKTFGVINIVCGIATWIICVFPMIYGRTSSCIETTLELELGPGYPVGAIYVATGILGVIALTKRTCCVVTAFLVMSIIAIACCIIMFFDSILALTGYCNMWRPTYGREWLVFAYSIPLILVTFVEMVVAVVSCVVACMDRFAS